MKRTIKTPNLEKTDSEIAKCNRREEERQFFDANFIASENYTSPAVREASSSVLTNKYSEGYPNARYYKGNDIAIDPVEILAQERALALFVQEKEREKWGVNVQPASGSEANLAVYGALLKPKNHPDGADVALGMDLQFGGHLTHGFRVSFSGKFFHFEQYGLDKNELIDYDTIEQLAQQWKPKLIVCGASAYSKIIDFERLSGIAKKADSLLMADIAHIAGLIAGGVHPSPFPHCDIVTTTTHKTLRGPRGALIFSRKDVGRSDPVTLKEKSIFQLINSAVFPGLQGGPHNQQTAAIAVCLKEANTPAFRAYTKRIVQNAQALAAALGQYGFRIVSQGTENHLLLIDLQAFKINGEEASELLYQAGIVVNKNVIPYDPLPPRLASGIRLGTPAMTTRGMGVLEMKKFARWIHEVITDRSKSNLTKVKKEVRALCQKFPPPGFA